MASTLAWCHQRRARCWLSRPWQDANRGLLGFAIGAFLETLGAIFAAGWADFMRDATPLAWMALAGIVAAGAGLLLWFRPGVRAAFDRD